MTKHLSKKRTFTYSEKDLNEMDRKNLLGFFALLLKVDRRVNPQLYNKKQNGNNGSVNDTDKIKNEYNFEPFQL
jgi:hypothetical protein